MHLTTGGGADDVKTVGALVAGRRFLLTLYDVNDVTRFAAQVLGGGADLAEARVVFFRRRLHGVSAPHATTARRHDVSRHVTSADAAVAHT